jgi:hypothetical protein
VCPSLSAVGLDAEAAWMGQAGGREFARQSHGRTGSGKEARGHSRTIRRPLRPSRAQRAHEACENRGDQSSLFVSGSAANTPTAAPRPCHSRIYWPSAPSVLLVGLSTLAGVPSRARPKVQRAMLRTPARHVVYATALRNVPDDQRDDQHKAHGCRPAHGKRLRGMQKQRAQSP